MNSRVDPENKRATRSGRPPFLMVWAGMAGVLAALLCAGQPAFRPNTLPERLAAAEK